MNGGEAESFSIKEIVRENKIKTFFTTGSEYLLQFEDAAQLRARTQAVQKAPVNLQSKVLQFNTVALSKESIQMDHVCSLLPSQFSSL